MRKKMILVCAVITAMVCVFGLAGCSNAGENTFGMVADKTGGVSSVSSQKQFADLQKSCPDAFSVSVQLPADYQGNCQCASGDNELGGYFMEFIDEQNRKADCGGLLFRLQFIPAGKQYEFPQFEKIGQIMKDGKAVYDFVLVLPSDVQYDLTNEKLTKNYESLAKEMQTVIDSVKFGEGYSLVK